MKEKTEQKGKNKNCNTWTYIICFVVVTAIVAGGIYFYQQNKIDEKNKRMTVTLKWSMTVYDPNGYDPVFADASTCYMERGSKLTVKTAEGELVLVSLVSPKRDSLINKTPPAKLRCTKTANGKRGARYCATLSTYLPCNDGDYVIDRLSIAESKEEQEKLKKKQAAAAKLHQKLATKSQ